MGVRDSDPPYVFCRPLVGLRIAVTDDGPGHRQDRRRRHGQGISATDAQADPQELVAVFNWFEELTRLVPTDP